MGPGERLARVLGRRGAAVDEPRPRRSPAPSGARSWVLLVLDSCRYDTFVEAGTPHLRQLGPVEHRWSWATWTAPAHHAMLMGLLPHRGERERWAFEAYAEEYARYRDRLGVELDLSRLAPSLWLPDLLRARGWVTGAWVSLPVLNEATPINRGFDRYRMRHRTNDLAGIIDDLRFYDDRPSFWLINAGETHYPYERPDREHQPLPRLSGVHGAVRASATAPPPPFDEARLRELRQRQVEAVRYADDLVPVLREMVPPGTWLTVTSDHGECFGEDGWFGHGPVVHDKVLEVPLVEGLLRAEEGRG